MSEDNATTIPTGPEATKGPQVICPFALRQARESFGVVITLLLAPNGSAGAKTFYAHFLMKMHTQFLTSIGGRPLETAGVSITDRLNLYINPYYWNKQTTVYKLDLLEHEIEHIVMKHILRSKDYIDTTKNAGGRHKCANIVMDAAINENKQSLHLNGVTVAKLNAELKKMGSRHTISLEDPWEVNYEKLMQAAKENPDQSGDGEGFGDPVDDHDTWGESTENKEVAEGIIKDAANKAQQATGIGNTPSHILREIENMNRASVSWDREMRQFATSTLRYDHEKTRNRRNRRYGVIQPGRRKKPKLKIAVCLDSSGSVHDEAFSQFFAELAEIHKMGIEIVCIDCDTAVAAVYDFDPKKPPKRYGNGGTSYSPGIAKAKELKADAIIQFGDMDASDHPSDPGVPFLWAVVGNNLNPPGKFGRVIQITTKRK